MALRVGHLWLINLNQPFRLGGLFLEFSQQIIQNHFLLPAHIPFYSENGLPFAYSPLGFYIQAFFIAVFHPSKFYTVNLIPPILAALSVPAFYFLAKAATRSRAELLAALLAYALIPNTFLNQIEAAGLAEACGTLAIMGYGYFLLRVYAVPTYRRAAFAGVFLAVCVLASPGSAYGAVLLSGVFGLNQAWRAIQKRSVKIFYPTLWIAILGIVISAPYWLTVMIQNGRGIFFVTFWAQHQGAVANPFWSQLLDKILLFNFAGGSYPFIWNSLIFLGLLGCLSAEGLPLALPFLCLLVIPREAIWIAAIPAALFAGIGLARYLLPVLSHNLQSLPSLTWRRILTGLGVVLFLSAALGNAIGGINAAIQDHQWEITVQQIRDLESARADIPENGKVIVIGNDAFIEWTPQILQREVLNTPYGAEWQPTELERMRYLDEEIAAGQNLDDFYRAVTHYHAVQEIYLVISKKSGVPAWATAPHSGQIAVKMGAETELINVMRISAR